MPFPKELLHIHLDKTTSTNDFVKENYQSFATHHLCVVSASLQTKGRGTGKKSWHSECQGNLYASFFFKAALIKDVSCLAHLCSLSCAKVLQSLDLDPKIKWPNDLLLHHKKIGGILCEILPVEGGYLVILGIGLNVNMPKKTLEEIDQPATSLLAETGKIFSVKSLLKEIGQNLQSNLSVFLEKGFDPFYQTFSDLMIYKGFPVKDASGKLIGISLGVTRDGLLEIKAENHTIKKIANGSIELRDL